MSKETYIQQLRRRVAECGMRPASLAKKAGLGINTLRHVWKDDWNPTWKTIQALEDVLGEK